MKACNEFAASSSQKYLCAPAGQNHAASTILCPELLEQRELRRWKPRFYFAYLVSPWELFFVVVFLLLLLLLLLSLLFDISVTELSSGLTNMHVASLTAKALRMRDNLTI